jgi:hypothetical protein
MTGDDFRRQADAVRSIPLEVVFTCWGAVRDRSDKAQWHTQRGPISVTGIQFFNWHNGQGGGGAIDLVMHLSGWDADQAIQWLRRQFGSTSGNAGSTANTTATSTTSACASTSGRSRWPSCGCDDDLPRSRTDKQLRLPTASLANLPRVRRYLTQIRGLSTSILAPLIDAGKLYADGRGNAVFLMVTGKAQRAIGAELRGTGKTIWQGIAPGTRKDVGYFWIGIPGSKKIVLCESAIDAISCFQLHAGPLHQQCICISTAGVRPGAPWLAPLIARDYDIYCGFDNDPPGEAAASQMTLRHPSIQRLCPPAHDWNDALTPRR